MKPKTSSFYWNIIENMHWNEATAGGVYPDTSAIKREFMETYSEKIAEQFNDWYRAKYNELSNAYDAAEKESGKRYGNFGGDDSFGDMLDHVMGLGETYYCAVMADFKLLNNLEPIESFAYCIPHTGDCMNDYDNMKPETHIAAALKALSAIVSTITECEKIDDDFAIMADTVNRLILISGGRFDDAVGDLNFDRDYRKYYGYDSCENGAMYANTLFDCKKYLT